MEIGSTATCNIWYRVWALAPQDNDVAALMADGYCKYMTDLRRLIASINLRLGARRAGQIDSLLTTVMDGLTIQIGHGKQRLPLHAGIDTACPRPVRRARRSWHGPARRGRAGRQKR